MDVIVDPYKRSTVEYYQVVKQQLKGDSNDSDNEKSSSNDEF